ncbi:MAG: hypothetical protein V1684_00340 [bacterium]
MWKECQYNQKLGNFTIFTDLITGEKDDKRVFFERFFPSLRKKILLRPLSGNPDQDFFIGFSNGAQCKYNTDLRTVGQGPFYMIADSRYFFLIAKTSIKLKVLGYHRWPRRKYPIF